MKANKIDAKLIFTSLQAHIKKIEYFVSIKKDSNIRKKVNHVKQKTQTDRGVRSLKTREVAKVTNDKVISSLKEDHGFNIFFDAFDKQKNPNSKLAVLAPFMLSETPEDITRCGNGLVSIVKNYMDTQKWKHNKPSTIKIKGTNKFGIDSGQLQESIGWEANFKISEKRKGKKGNKAKK